MTSFKVQGFGGGKIRSKNYGSIWNESYGQYNRYCDVISHSMYYSISNIQKYENDSNYRQK